MVMEELEKMLEEYDDLRMKAWAREAAGDLREKIKKVPRPLMIRVEQHLNNAGWTELITLDTRLNNHVNRNDAQTYLEDFRSSTFNHKNGSYVWVSGGLGLVRINFSDGPIRMYFIHQNPDPESATKLVVL